ncbi:esterase [Hahella sp. CCB-MM4]|uniref:alpha/beta hydrolase n=1 Tax=Hahella sp. (strain CCB-MM4) TaxID=1926491 RepID=UPI000B9B88FB|nr:alpha/beta hydrolase [Hahella sp. CCB-MM4]OZG75273.1 esterase [Hahella sp. CCB-MM4]
MNRTKVVKDMIRLGMRFIPNHLLAYRLCASQSIWFVHPPTGFRCEAGLAFGIPALWLSHERECDARVILYLHGGGYVVGSTRTHLELACRIGRASQAQVMMLEYRLAPENPYPAALEDAVLAYQYLLDNGVKAHNIIVAGDSAGGGLTLATVMAIRDSGLPVPAGAVCLSPWLDLSCCFSSISHRIQRDPIITPERVRFFARHYAAGQSLIDPGISPYFGDLRDLPPVLIQVGSDEILLNECKYFCRRAKRIGVPVHLHVWPHMFHVWHFAARLLPQSRSAIRDIGQFVQTQAPVHRRKAA